MNVISFAFNKRWRKFVFLNIFVRVRTKTTRCLIPCSQFCCWLHWHYKQQKPTIIVVLAVAWFVSMFTRLRATRTAEIWPVDGTFHSKTSRRSIALAMAVGNFRFETFKGWTVSVDKPFRLAQTFAPRGRAFHALTYGEWMDEWMTPAECTLPLQRFMNSYL